MLGAHENEDISVRLNFAGPEISVEFVYPTPASVSLFVLFFLGGWRNLGKFQVSSAFAALRTLSDMHVHDGSGSRREIWKYDDFWCIKNVFGYVFTPCLSLSYSFYPLVFLHWKLCCLTLGVVDDCCLLRRLWWLFFASTFASRLLPVDVVSLTVACRVTTNNSNSNYNVTLMNSINTFWPRQRLQAKGLQQRFILPQLFAVAAKFFLAAASSKH